MELVVVFLCSLSGALIGAAVGIFLLFPKVRHPAGEAGLALLEKNLRIAEESLAGKTTELEDLRKQIVDRDQTILRNEEAVKAEQKQLDIAVAERDASEQKARDLNTQVEALADQRNELLAKAKEEKDLGAETANQQTASYEAQIDASKRRLDELTAQVLRLAAEAAENRTACEQEKLQRSAVETQLDVEREHIREMAARIQQLEGEQSQFDLRLEEERQSAAKGMELLLMAQENFARVVKPRAADGSNGGNGHAAIEAVGALLEAQGDGAPARLT